jgi:hypothetical protein
MATICTLRLTAKANFSVTVAEVDEAGYRPLCTFIFPNGAVKNVLDGITEKVTKAEFKPKPRK